MATTEFVEIFRNIEQSIDPDSVYMVADDFSLTYGELIRNVRRLAAFMEASNLQIGARMILATDKDDEFMSYFIAAMLCGIATVPLDPAARPDEANYYVTAADVSLIVGSSDYVNNINLQNLASNAIVIVTDDRNESIGPAIDSRTIIKTGPTKKDPWHEITSTTTSQIMFTSGTTSMPKGIELSHKNLLTHMLTVINHYGLNDSSRIMSNIPIFHADGVFHNSFPAFLVGGRSVRASAITFATMESFAREIYDQTISHLIVVPTNLVLMKTFADLIKPYFRSPAFQFIVSTSAPLSEALWREIETELDVQVVNVYGLTETVLESFFCGPSAETRKVGTIGKPIDCHVRIVDEQMNDLGINEIGELLLSGDHIMKGYFRAPEQTADALRNGWLYTGDMATVDEEGFYRIVGRKKSMVKVAGEAVYPDDATNVLREHPDVFDACSFGLPHEIIGEQLVSCVILDDGSRVTAEQLVDFCKTRMSDFKVPKDIHIMGTFPRGPAGKVKIDVIKDIVKSR